MPATSAGMTDERQRAVTPSAHSARKLVRDSHHPPLIPAQAGIQNSKRMAENLLPLGSRLRGNERSIWLAPLR